MMTVVTTVVYAKNVCKENRSYVKGFITRRRRGRGRAKGEGEEEEKKKKK
jgi:hypothetical protein